jgi:hypothetical protein
MSNASVVSWLSTAGFGGITELPTPPANLSTAHAARAMIEAWMP